MHPGAFHLDDKETTLPVYDKTRTQWFNAGEQTPVHEGRYEFRDKYGFLGKPDTIHFRDYTSGHWAGLFGFLGCFEWRGLANKPEVIQ